MGTNDILDTPAAVSPAPNAWKPANPPTHQALLLDNPQPRQNDDRSLTSYTDNASIANTLATFETNLTSAITTIFEQQNHQRTIERKDAAEAETRREEQRKADNIVQEQRHRDEVHRLEKLEERRDEERAAKQLRRDREQDAEQLKNQQLMVTMMQNMFQQSNQHQQQIPITAILPTPTAKRLHSEEPTSTHTSAT